MSIVSCLCCSKNDYSDLHIYSFYIEKGPSEFYKLNAETSATKMGLQNILSPKYFIIIPHCNIALYFGQNIVIASKKFRDKWFDQKN